MEVKVKFVDLKLKEVFDSLEVSDPRLYKEIDRAIGDIKGNIYCGRNVKRKLIPKFLMHKYGIRNLWIYNLRKDWRLLYSLVNDEVDILALVLSWMNHKDYERLFGFG